MKKPVLLMILDGFALISENKGNAVNAAKKPNIDKLFADNPHCFLKTSGLAVGLPEGQMGNSEVGHTNIGAGRIVYQELTRITKSINDGDFFTNTELLTAMKSENLHIMGLLSPGGVHSHTEHLKALIEMAKRQNVKNVYVHAFLDGRDTPPTSAEKYVSEIEKIANVVTVSGRFYAMDRDKRWDRVEKAYNNMLGLDSLTYTSAAEYIKESYENQVNDEFVLPGRKSDFAGIKDNDSVIFYNFRPDRAREITRAFVDSTFNGFNRKKINLDTFVCMTTYDATIENVAIAFKPNSPHETLGEIVSNYGLNQLRIAETEKYAHVTFFFNGGREEQFANEDRILVPSPKVATYDLKPEMSAFEVTDKLSEALDTNKYDLIILNYANCDMVGHTGVFDAAVKAVEAVDICVGKIVSKVQSMGGITYITADHGNSEKMLSDDGTPYTAHSTNDVPFIAIGVDKKLHDGALCDISPTILKEMGLPQPKVMTGKPLYE